jgi:hypothetical protein
MPWMVAFYGVLVIPLGLVHILLVVSQPVVVGAWCTFCLLAALIMLPMLPLEGDEVVAMLQHMRQAKRRGEPLWSVFWKGGQPEGATQDERSPALASMPEKPLRVVKAGFWGMSAPWTLWASVALGLWLTFSPVVWSATGPDKKLLHAAGLLVIVVAVVAMGEVFRLFRYLNVLLGFAVAVLPWAVGDAHFTLQVQASLVGMVVALLAVPRGPKYERYGSWDALVA